MIDNGPQFKIHKYLRFAQEYGFTIVKSSPYYSQGNGKAESAVKIAKNILKKSQKEDLYLALLETHLNRVQKHTSTGLQLTPQAASPSLVYENIAERRWRSMAQYNKRVSQPLKEFS